MKKIADNDRPVNARVKRINPKISNVEELRDYMLISLDRLENFEITVQEAGVVGKMCEGIMSTVRTEMEYNRLTDRDPDIDFLGRTPSRTSKGIPALPKPKRKTLEHNR